MDSALVHVHEDGRVGGFGRLLSVHPSVYICVVQLHPPRPHLASHSEVAWQPRAASVGGDDGGEGTRTEYGPAAPQLQCHVVEDGPWLWNTGASLWT